MYNKSIYLIMLVLVLGVTSCKNNPTRKALANPNSSFYDSIRGAAKRLDNTALGKTAHALNQPVGIQLKFKGTKEVKREKEKKRKEQEKRQKLAYIEGRMNNLQSLVQKEKNESRRRNLIFEYRKLANEKRRLTKTTPYGLSDAWTELKGSYHPDTIDTAKKIGKKGIESAVNILPKTKQGWANLRKSGEISNCKNRCGSVYSSQIKHCRAMPNSLLPGTPADRCKSRVNQSRTQCISSCR